MKTPQYTLPGFDAFSEQEMCNYAKTLRGPYSQAEFAGILGVDSSAVDNWEHGRSRPQPRMIRRMLEHYQSWAIQLRLPEAANQAMKAAGIKKHLTRNPESDTTQGERS